MSFLADLYLMDMDFHFQDEGVFYARYADDILILADSEEELEEYREYVCNHLASKGLSMNPKKEHIYSPGETIEFLGFGIDGGKVDLADITVKKIKAKIRRASRRDASFFPVSKHCSGVRVPSTESWTTGMSAFA